MKKADKICILLIMAACVLFYIPLWFAYDAQENREVVVKVRNKEVLRTDLMKDGSYTVDGKENSPHHYCSIQGYVSDPSTPIICLPNEVVVTIEGSEESTVDTAIQ